MNVPAVVYEAAASLSSVLSRRSSHRAADWITDAAFRIARDRREAVRENLRIAGFASGDEAVRSVFRNFGRYCADFVYYTRRGGSPPRVRFENMEYLESALSHKKGAVVLSAHVGNWELGAAAIATRHPVSVVIHEHPEPDTNAFFNRRREAYGVRPIPIGTALRKCLAVLASNEVVGLLGDRRYGTDGMEVEFFGRRTLLPRGPAFLSMRSGAPIVGAAMLPEENGGFVMRFTETIRPEKWGEAAFCRETALLLERLIRPNAFHWLVFDPVWPRISKEASYVQRDRTR